MQPFGFAVPTRVTFGAGCRHELPKILGQEQWVRVGLAVDENLRSSPLVMELITNVRERCDEFVLGWNRSSEPTYDSLEELRGQFASRTLQAIVGIGGGSTIDTAKAMAALIRNARPAIEYRGFDRLTEPVLPIVAIPTTAGTGSEVTPNASFVDRRELRKMGINGEVVRPRHALLDPDLTLTCPSNATISAAVDALVHATEAFVARRTNALARALAREGFRHVFGNLPRVLDEPENVSWRSEVMLGAFMAGLALMHSGTGPAAAMSYPLGVRHNVAHGIAGGVFLPRVASSNIARGVVDYAQIYDVMEGADRTRSETYRARAFVDRMFEMWSRVGVPADLRCFGVTTCSQVSQLVLDTLELKGALEQNPVPFGEVEIREVLFSLVEVAQ